MLSICIPTYNRAEFLDWTLQKIVQDFPDAQVIVSNNASADTTRGLLAYFWPTVHAIHQESNIGAFANMYAALTAAKGKYAVYCGDDDYLLPEEIGRGIAYLEAHPQVAAYCAPCEIYDEVNHKPFWNAFHVEHERLFTKNDGMELFNFLISSHVWPEHIIYRTPVPLLPRTRAYWAFTDLVSILDTGSIFFSSTPFYRNLLVHPIGEREQLGNVQCLTHFDEYRAGLEVLAHGLFGCELPYKTRSKINEMISYFIWMRLDAASQLYARKGEMAEALMLRQRMSIANPRRDSAS
jgi:glycosyltransferase involved in cell wall biosynthesis